ncbi:MAG TPA: hypothetical protein VML75_20905, partial [Kofleriaceae bacterium]|nr:hypothetical protein [Kofleriaceae bacterium]
MRRVALVLVLAIVMAACGDDSPEGAREVKRGDPRAAIQYPANAAGLEGLLTALINAVRSEREADIAALTASLELPDHERWFASTFGDELGARLSDEYAPVTGQFTQLARLIEGLIASEQT